MTHSSDDHRIAILGVPPIFINKTQKANKQVKKKNFSHKKIKKKKGKQQEMVPFSQSNYLRYYVLKISWNPSNSFHHQRHIHPSAFQIIMRWEKNKKENVSALSP
ncbi:hypothetical protein CIPAW_02G041900 [Carya illinoinensis]|uniref:Uncharacterized protein n=1 Tax=Carya illinoinensis TaxID=32201 RepID=A0A8T1RC80_CARIL|nr:hypothetical protein CIPAW_02G041900 [Carya illinoinensis]